MYYHNNMSADFNVTVPMFVTHCRPWKLYNRPDLFPGGGHKGCLNQAVVSFGSVCAYVGS